MTERQRKIEREEKQQKPNGKVKRKTFLCFFQLRQILDKERQKHLKTERQRDKTKERQKDRKKEKQKKQVKKNCVFLVR